MPEPFDEELAALRARIRQVEAMAAATPPRAGLHDAIADRMSGLRPPPDPARARLEVAARGFVPDPQSEAALAARAKDPAAYDAEMQRVRVSGLELALYARQRSAAIAVGTFRAETPEGDES